MCINLWWYNEKMKTKSHSQKIIIIGAVNILKVISVQIINYLDLNTKPFTDHE